MLLSLFAVLAFICNVPTNITEADVTVFNGDLQLAALKNHQTFSDEIDAIKTIQHRVFAKAPVGSGIPDFEPREPSD